MSNSKSKSKVEVEVGGVGGGGDEGVGVGVNRLRFALMILWSFIKGFAIALLSSAAIVTLLYIILNSK